jgi:hypothetical protein
MSIIEEKTRRRADGDEDGERKSGKRKEKLISDPRRWKSSPLPGLREREKSSAQMMGKVVFFNEL